RRLQRTPAASGEFPVTVKARPAPSAPVTASSAGVFPVRGAWSFGGPDAGFGARRNGHTHQGQDVFAAEHTPLFSPVAGTVSFRSVQPAGAGHYLVIRDTGGRDYVFMHLVAGSERVDRGDAVRPGQPIGAVGHTGDAQGSHLHFELWPDGWYAPRSAPVDPLATLTAWAA
ncbi:MAG: M23 family metallopeptidase, partial [Solirubrobacteraceae bacterium]